MSREAGRTLCLFAWHGASLAVSCPDGRWCERLSDLLGLAADPVYDRPLDIRVHDELNLRCFETELNFNSQCDLLIWLSLTIFDVLAEAAGAFLLHAAALRVGGGLVLLPGPPRAGKSTLALRAGTRGFRVIGDDVVAISPTTLEAEAAPRPLRERIPAGELLPCGTNALAPGRPLEGRLDGEACRLYPREIGGLATRLTVLAICFLNRHSGPGIHFQTPQSFVATRQLLDHARAFGPRPMDSLTAVAKLIGRCDCVMLSVGDGETNTALDALSKRYHLGVT